MSSQPLLGRLSPLRTSLFLVGVLALASCGDLREDLSTGLPPEGVEPALSAGPQGIPIQEFGPAIRAANRHTARLMANPNIVGTGVGLNEEGEPAVRVFLLHDRVRGIPSELDGVPVAAEVTGLFVVERGDVDREARARPAPIGFSVGHPNVTAGTLGARVTDGTNVYILSNNHVLANSNEASIGDPTLQPGSFDGGSAPDDVIGTLHDFQPISFSGSNTMDAAISIVGPDAVSGSTPYDDGYGSPSTNTTSATVGMGVQKYGRTTGLTLASVEEVNVTVSVCFEARGPFMCARSATFVDQFTITPGSFSGGGDSGSLIVTQNGNHPVGLLFAGSSTRTVANPINVVLERFGVTIDPTVPDVSEPTDPGEDPDDTDPTDPTPDEPGDGELSVDQFTVSTRTTGPWRRADATWSVSHTGGGLESVTTELLGGGTVLDSQTSSVSGSNSSGEHTLRSRSTPDTVRLIVIPVDGEELVEEHPVSF